MPAQGPLPPLMLRLQMSALQRNLTSEYASRIDFRLHVCRHPVVGLEVGGGEGAGRVPFTRRRPRHHAAGSSSTCWSPTRWQPSTGSWAESRWWSCA